MRIFVDICQSHQYMFSTKDTCEKLSTMKITSILRLQ